METPIIVAIVGILGIVTGAFVQYLFNKRFETSRQFNLLQTQSYIDFIKGISGSGKAQFLNDKEKEKEFIILAAEARLRVSIYGSEDVIKKIAKLFREHEGVNSEKAKDEFSELINLMRKESIGRPDFVSNDEIKEVVFGGKTVE